MFSFIQRGDVTLFNGDCLEVMPMLSVLTGGDFNMVLADPPYGTTACKWDSIIPLEQMWSNLKSLVKSNGAIMMTSAQPFTTTLISSNINDFKYCWVWKKNQPGGFAQAKNMPLKQHEDIALFSDGVSSHVSQSKNRICYNPQGLIYSPKITKNTNRHDQESSFGNRPSHKNQYVQEFTNYPNSILEFNCERGKHSTQKPVALMEYLIRTYTNEGETVLDFTMGSGTTGVACQNTGRKFVGIELDPDYFKIACERMGITGV